MTHTHTHTHIHTQVQGNIHIQTHANTHTHTLTHTGKHHTHSRKWHLMCSMSQVVKQNARRPLGPINTTASVDSYLYRDEILPLAQPPRTLHPTMTQSSPRSQTHTCTQTHVQAHTRTHTHKHLHIRTYLSHAHAHTHTHIQFTEFMQTNTPTLEDMKGRRPPTSTTTRTHVTSKMFQ